MQYLPIRIALVVLVLAVAFRVATPAYVQMLCVNSQAMSNACLVTAAIME